MAPLAIVLRVFVSYTVLVALLRASGKVTIAQGTVFDFVLALVLGDMIDDVLWGEVSTATFVAAVGTLALMHALVLWAQSALPSVRRLVAGEATLLLKNGQPVASGMRLERVSEAELEELMRLWGVPRERWDEVETMLLADDGRASLYKKQPYHTAGGGEVPSAPDPQP